MIDKDTVIRNINEAKSYRHVFTDLTNWKKDYISFVRLLHPDHGNGVEEEKALVKLNRFKDEIENGIAWVDDTGKGVYKPGQIIKNASNNAMEKAFAHSRDNHSLLMRTDNYIKLYIPGIVELPVSEQMCVKYSGVAVPLSRFSALEEEHVKWIYSRMIEFAAIMKRVGFVHAGLTPDSVFITPDSHGIVIPTFYHMIKSGENLKTISGRWRDLYPSHAISTKRAASSVDVEMVKNIALIFLSKGNPAMLRKKYSKELSDYFLRYHDNALDAFKEWREYIKNHTERKFHEFPHF